MYLKAPGDLGPAEDFHEPLASFCVSRDFFRRHMRAKPLQLPASWMVLFSPRRHPQRTWRHLNCHKVCTEAASHLFEWNYYASTGTFPMNMFSFSWAYCHGGPGSSKRGREQTLDNKCMWDLTKCWSFFGTSSTNKGRFLITTKQPLPKLVLPDLQRTRNGTRKAWFRCCSAWCFSSYPLYFRNEKWY